MRKRATEEKAEGGQRSNQAGRGEGEKSAEETRAERYAVGPLLCQVVEEEETKQRPLIGCTG